MADAYDTMELLHLNPQSCITAVSNIQYVSSLSAHPVSIAVAWRLVHVFFFF
jgi:hypothetical protein